MTFKKKLWNQLPLFLRKNLIDHKQCGLMLDFKEAQCPQNVTKKAATLVFTHKVMFSKQPNYLQIFGPLLGSRKFAIKNF